MRKRITAAILSAALLCGFMPALKGNTAEIIVNEDDTLLSFDDLREMFPADRYWNHMGMDTNDPKCTTDIPCDHSTYGEKYCNKSYQYDSQCYGYAQELGLLMYGTRFRYWECDNNTDNLKAGDVITYGYVGQFGGHTVMVTDVKDDIVYYTDCNTGGTCRISWNGRRSKSFFSSQFIEEPGLVAINGVYHAPYKAPEHFIETGCIMTEEEAAGQTLPDGDYQIVSSLKRNFFLNHADITVQEQNTNVQMKLFLIQKHPENMTSGNLLIRTTAFIHCAKRGADSI